MGVGKIDAKGGFFDRDGTINNLVYNPLTQAYESPHRVNDFSLMPKVIDSLKSIQSNGFMLFLVSNQPSYAKGKTSLEEIKAIHSHFDDMMRRQGIKFREYYYCYHHPEGTVAEYTRRCECRKPKPFFLLKAAKDYSLDMNASWMIGDQDFDILCGQAAGVKTILLNNILSAHKRVSSTPDFFAADLSGAVQIVLSTINLGG